MRRNMRRTDTSSIDSLVGQAGRTPDTIDPQSPVLRLRVAYREMY